MKTLTSIAGENGFTLSKVLYGNDTLQVAYKKTAPTRAAHLYIEGDGFAWKNRHEPSADPTPMNPLAMRLAAVDPHPLVIYLARPCQYVHPEQCDTNDTLWTSHRFSNEVINQYQRALNVLKDDFGIHKFHVIGYSGGGAIAALLAVERKDIASIRTVAGNLDIEAFAKHHGVEPLSGSHNPARIAWAIRGIPQIHFVGTQDRIVPRSLAERYVQNIRSMHAPPRCLPTIHDVPGMTHDSAWEKIWAELLQVEMGVGRD